MGKEAKKDLSFRVFNISRGKAVDKQGPAYNKCYFNKKKKHFAEKIVSLKLLKKVKFFSNKIDNIARLDLFRTGNQFDIISGVHDNY